MSKFDDMNKQTIPDPLTGGTQDVYTSKDGTFMMCIPDRCLPVRTSDFALSKYNLRSENKGNGVRVWTWESPQKTEDAEFEIIQPKQISQ